jgi:hypothetical protein
MFIPESDVKVRMMTDNRTNAYRAARRAFIAACETAGVDAIARVAPGQGADGRPLFMDAAALGARTARKAALVIADDAPGSAVLTQLLRKGVRPAPDARLVLLHAFDPARFAGAVSDGAWALDMLGAVATEDLSKVRTLKVLTLARHGETDAMHRILAARLPDAEIGITVLMPDMEPLRDRLARFPGILSAD